MGHYTGMVLLDLQKAISIYQILAPEIVFIILISPVLGLLVKIVFIILVLSYGTIYLCLSALHKPEMGLKIVLKTFYVSSSSQ